MSAFLETPPSALSVRPPESGGSLRLTVVRPTPATAVIEVDGELDATTAPRLAHLLGPRLTSALRIVVVDLSAVTHLDATGLGVLVHARHQATITGRTLELITRPGAVKRALENVGLEPRA